MRLRLQLSGVLAFLCLAPIISAQDTVKTDANVGTVVSEKDKARVQNARPAAGIVPKIPSGIKHPPPLFKPAPVTFGRLALEGGTPRPANNNPILVNFGKLDLNGNNTVITSGTPYAALDEVILDAFPNGSLGLGGPIINVPAERQQGGWAAGILQANVLLSPPQAELIQLAAPGELQYGELLADATYQYPNNPTRVRNPSVVFEIPISFTGSGNQWTGGQWECGAESCSPEYPSDGTLGVYLARVEECLAITDRHPTGAVTDRGGNPIPCNTADGIVGNNGFWYDIAPQWTSTTLGDLAESTQQVSSTLKVSAKLLAPSNSVRLEIVLGLKNDSGGFINSLYWGYNYQNVSGPESAVTRFAVQLPVITVMPAAFMQMKVLPYTIIYRPPGDQSLASYTATQAYGTSLNLGSSVTVDTTKSFENSFGVMDDQKVTALVATVQQSDGQTHTYGTSWDDNALIGKGLMVSGSHQVVRGMTVGSASPDSSIVPAHEYVAPNTCTKGNYSPSTCKVMSAGTYDQDPFWGDRIVLLLNPQSALWDLNGKPNMQLLGASDFTEVSVRDLDACAKSPDPNAWKLAPDEWLTPSECQELLTLDPFYGFGQGLDPSTLGRGVYLGRGTYGRDPLNSSSPFGVKFSDVFNYQIQQSTNGTTSYNATVTNVIGFSWSDGLSLSYSQGMYGLTASAGLGTTITQGHKDTTNTSLKYIYTASTVSTDTNATQIDGSFADDHSFFTPSCQQNPGQCYTPAVRVFIDELFGGYMFQDQDAACNPTICCPRISCTAAPYPVEY